MSESEIDHAEHAAAIAEFNEKAALRRIAVLDRVAKLETALKQVHAHICAFGSDEDLAVIDAALSETVEA